MNTKEFQHNVEQSKKEALNIFYDFIASVDVLSAKCKGACKDIYHNNKQHYDKIINDNMPENFIDKKIFMKFFNHKFNDEMYIVICPGTILFESLEKNGRWNMNDYPQLKIFMKNKIFDVNIDFFIIAELNHYSNTLRKISHELMDKKGTPFKK